MATRFYLPSSGSPSITPTPDAAWEDIGEVSYFATSTTKAGSAMADRANADSSETDRDVLEVGYVSEPLAAQTIGVQTLEFQMRGRENATGNNMFLALGVRVLSGDGGTVRGTILAVTRDATELPTGTLTNRRLTATTTSVTAQAGDILVFEIGAGGDPSAGNSHDFTIRVGDADAADLPEDDTDQTDKNPWIEFPNTISFGAGGGGNAARALQQYRRRRL